MVDQHYDVVWRALGRLGVRPEAIDDAAQQVFLVGARKVDDIRLGQERPFLLGVAVRVASDNRRSQGRRPESPSDHDDRVPDPALGPDELVDRKRAREALDGILAALPHDLRTAFVLFELEGMTLPEVAEALCIPLGTATSRLRRAREAFRHDVERRFGAPSALRGTTR